jgi:crotonobetainyl-CoA:carnitine CoA-transferase CaiB-like acyl-CoA transferase
MSGPLAGARVLDLTQGVAGPYATKLFSDYGAEVLKIERPGAGDPSRGIGPFPDDTPNPEASGMFLHLNTGKQSVTLNLKTATGRRLLLRLAAEADLILESFRPGTLERLGIGPDVLAEASPTAALVRISSFGQDGPYRDFEADDMLLYAAGGVMQVTGDPDRAPLKLGLYTPLFLAGVVSAGMAMGALRSSMRDQRGERVEISIHEILTASMDRGGPNIVAYQYSGSLMIERVKNVRYSALPNGVFPCADGYVQVATQPAWFPRMCRAMDRPDLMEDERITSNLYNPDFAPEIEAIFYPWVLSHTKQQVMEIAQAEGWPVCAMNTVDDAYRDPGYRARDFFAKVDHPATGALEYPGLPVRFRGTPGEIRRAPLLGEHTSDVLTKRLGYTPEEVAILRQRDVI